MWLAVIVLAIAIDSVLPILMVLMPPFLGHWLVPFFGATQHLGLADDAGRRIGKGWLRKRNSR